MHIQNLYTEPTKQSNLNSLSMESSLSEEIRQLKQDYMDSGGQNQLILEQIRMLEDESRMLERDVPYSRSFDYHESCIRGLERKKRHVKEESSDSEAEELKKMEKQHRKAMMMLKNEMEILTQQLEIDKMRKLLPLSPSAVPVAVDDPNNPTQKGAKDKPSNMAFVNPVINNVNPVFVKGGKGSILNVEPSTMRSDTSTIHLPSNADSYMNYSIDRGLYLFINYIVGLPKMYKDSEINCTYSVFEGAESRNDLEVARSVIEFDGKTHIAFFKSTVNLKNIMPIKSFRIIFEFRTHEAQSRNYRNLIPVGWASFDLFNDRFMPDYGSWILPVFRPPLDFNYSTAHLYNSSQSLPGLFLTISLLDKSKKDPITQSILPPDELRPFESKKYNAPMAGQELYPNAEKPKRKNLSKTDPLLLQKPNSITPSQNPISVQRNLNELVSELYAMEVAKAGNKGKKNWKGYDDTASSKRAIGFHLEDIKNFNYSSRSLKIRLRFADILEETPVYESDSLHEFTSMEAEAGVTDGTYGWPGQLYIEFPDIVANPNKRAIIEIDGKAIASAEMQIFKVHMQQVYDIDEGPRRLAMFKVGNDLDSSKASTTSGTVTLRIYNPANGRPSEFKFESRMSVKPIPEYAWIACKNDPPRGKENYYRDGDGFALFIDSARFLPENVGITRVVARLDGDTRKSSKNEIQTKVNMNTLLYNPQYEASNIFTIDEFEYDQLILFHLFTLDPETEVKKIIGIASINLFINDELKKSAYYINEGAFQLPILYISNSQDIERETPRVPCSSLLIRLKRIPALQLREPLRIEEIPVYTNKVYDSSKDTPKPYEDRLYYYVSEERSQLTIMESVLRKGKEIDEKSIVKLDKKLAYVVNESVTLIDRSFIALYNPNFGFKVSLDAAYNIISSKTITFGTVSYVCKSSSNDQMAAMEDMRNITRLDYSSGIRFPKWTDGYLWYRFKKYEKFSYLIIQLYSVALDTSSVKLEGWTLLPLFSDSEYVSMGNFILPMYEGNPPKEVLNSAIRKGADAALIQGLQSDTIRVKKTLCMTVRLCDGRRAEELTFSSAYSFTKVARSQRLKFALSGSSAAISTLIPKKMNRTDYESQTIRLFNDKISTISSTLTQ